MQTETSHEAEAASAPEASTESAPGSTLDAIVEANPAVAETTGSSLDELFESASAEHATAEAPNTSTPAHSLNPLGTELEESGKVDNVFGGEIDKDIDNIFLNIVPEEGRREVKDSSYKKAYGEGATVEQPDVKSEEPAAVESTAQADANSAMSQAETAEIPKFEAPETTALSEVQPEAAAEASAESEPKVEVPQEPSEPEKADNVFGTSIDKDIDALFSEIVPEQAQKEVKDSSYKRAYGQTDEAESQAVTAEPAAPETASAPESPTEETSAPALSVEQELEDLFLMQSKEAERARIAAEQAEQAEQERLEAEPAEQERAEAERAEQERLESERVAAEKLKQRERTERAEQERAEQEKAEQEKAEQERLEAEKAEKARIEVEQKAAEAAPQAPPQVPIRPNQNQSRSPGKIQSNACPSPKFARYRRRTPQQSGSTRKQDSRCSGDRNRPSSSSALNRFRSDGSDGSRVGSCTARRTT